jgi:hypothetical protein
MRPGGNAADRQLGFDGVRVDLGRPLSMPRTWRVRRARPTGAGRALIAKPCSRAICRGTRSLAPGTTPTRTDPASSTRRLSAVTCANFVAAWYCQPAAAADDRRHDVRLARGARGRWGGRLGPATSPCSSGRGGAPSRRRSVEQRTVEPAPALAITISVAGRRGLFDRFRATSSSAVTSPDDVDALRQSIGRVEPIRRRAAGHRAALRGQRRASPPRFPLTRH